MSNISDILEQAKRERVEAWNNLEHPMTLPCMEVTQEQYEVIRDYGNWVELDDGREVWGGVQVEVVDE